jgi:hypothetical protein
MGLKKLGAALFVVAAISAVLASSALAAATTTDVKWYTGASPGTELTPSATIVIVAVGTGTFETTVVGTGISFSYTTIELIAGTIENTGGVAVGSGQLKFGGVSVTKPAKCTTTSTITTKPLSFTADWMIGSTNYWKFVPTAGEESGFFSFELTGSECALKTTIVPKGSFFVQTVNATGTQATSQRVNSSGTINSTAGGNLHVGTEAATLEATADFSLSSGAAFGTH